MRAKAKFIERDRGWNKILDNVRRTKGLRLDVGFMGAEASAQHGESRLTVAIVAAIHEFGGGRVPERSYLRSTFEANQTAYFALIETAVSLSVYGTSTVESALAHVGSVIVADVQQAIRNGIKPDLSEETLRKKRAKNQPDTPLIATEQMIDAISFAVRREFRDAIGRFAKKGSKK